MSVNKVMLIGRLGRDPETRYTMNNEPVCNFSIATDENWKDKEGNRQTRTEWHNIVMFGRLAEIAQQYIQKGSLVFIEGRIQSRKYQAKDGTERTAYEIVANEMKMLGGKSESSASFASSHPEHAAQTPHPAPTPKPPQAPNNTNNPSEPMDDLEDDIPF